MLRHFRARARARIKCQARSCTRPRAHSRIKRIRSAFAGPLRIGESVARLRCILYTRYQVCRMRRRAMFTGIVPRAHNTVTCVHALSRRRGSLIRVTNFTRFVLISLQFFPFIVISFHTVSCGGAIPKKTNSIS